MFTLEECTEAVSQSKAEVVCAHHQHVSKVEDVVPGNFMFCSPSFFLFRSPVPLSTNFPLRVA